MAWFRKKREYDPLKIERALEPYHYPEDHDGTPKPTPRKQFRSKRPKPKGR